MIGANFAKYVTSPVSHSSSHEQFANDEGRKGRSEVHAEAGGRAGMGTLAGIDLIRENLSDDRPGARGGTGGEETDGGTDGGRGELSKKANVAHDEEEEEEDSWTDR